MNPVVSCANDIVEESQCGFRKNISPSHIIALRQTLDKLWEFKKSVSQLFVDFLKDYDFFVRGKLYKILSHNVPGKYTSLFKWVEGWGTARWVHFR